MSTLVAVFDDEDRGVPIHLGKDTAGDVVARIKAMPAALAGALIASGHDLTVWNRSAENAVRWQSKVLRWQHW